MGSEGERRWLETNGDTNLLNKYEAALARDNQFVHLILSTREKLENVYGDTLDKDGNVEAAKTPPLPPEQLKQEKQRVFAELRTDYEQLKAKAGAATRRV